MINILLLFTGMIYGQAFVVDSCISAQDEYIVFWELDEKITVTETQGPDEYGYEPEIQSLYAVYRQTTITTSHEKKITGRDNMLEWLKNAPGSVKNIIVYKKIPVLINPQKELTIE